MASIEVVDLRSAPGRKTEEEKRVDGSALLPTCQSRRDLLTDLPDA